MHFEQTTDSDTALTYQVSFSAIGDEKQLEALNKS